MTAINLDVRRQGRPVPDLDRADAIMAGLSAWVRDTWVAALSGAVLPGMVAPVAAPGLAGAVRVVRRGPGHYEVVCDSAAAAAIERGHPPYDLKAGMLASPRARRTADGAGVYLRVPLRHFTPGPRGAIRPSARPDGSNTMPPDVRRYVRDVGPHPASDDFRRTRLAGPLNERAAAFGAAPVAQGDYTWRTGRHSGLRRERTAGGAYRYMTYRTVATRRYVVDANGRGRWRGSHPASWVHPGARPNPVARAVVDHTRPTIDRVLAQVPLLSPGRAGDARAAAIRRIWGAGSRP